MMSKIHKFYVKKNVFVLQKMSKLHHNDVIFPKMLIELTDEFYFNCVSNYLSILNDNKFTLKTFSIKCTDRKVYIN